MAKLDLDNLDITMLKRRHSEKWAGYPENILPAWVAEMDFPLADPIRDVLRRAVEFDDLGYPVGPRRNGLPSLFADRMQERFGWQVDPNRCEIITDVVQGMYVALSVFSEPGDGVVIQTPIYPPFLSSVAECKREVVENRLVIGTAGWEIDFDGLRASIDSRTRILMFCNPHNPSGRAFRREELEELGRIVCEKNLIVVSDEIHGDLLFDGRVHIPFASINSDVAARTITLTSATKAFNIAGLRCAIAHFGSAEIRQRFNQIPRHLRGGVGLLGIEATVAAWRDSSDWLEEVRSYLEQNRNFMMEFLAKRIPSIVCHPAEATYLAWLDCKAWGLSESPSKRLYQEQQLAVNDGHSFGGEAFGQYIRINFATSRAILSEVLERIEKTSQQL